ncbi:hypothetical protein [Photorhabdus asymbiotica]|uniref:hypothetical protein n=1 Tax=Photorhabdus asymbiotica TaxID=291112 RepID=UPI003DA700EA
MLAIPVPTKYKPPLSLSAWDAMLEERLDKPTIEVKLEVETVAAQQAHVVDFL